MRENTDFQMFCNILNRKAKEMQNVDVKEDIDEETAYIAMLYIKNMYIEDIGDALLFISAANLLNTYVKQSDSKIGYEFKKDVYNSILIFIDKNIPNITYSVEQEKERVFLINFYELQFSFHGLDKKIYDITEKYISHNIWDGVKKQKCAKTMFLLAKDNKLNRCMKTYRNKDLDKVVSKKIEKGIISWNDFYKGV